MDDSPEQLKAGGQSQAGASLSVAIVVVVLVLGGLYFFAQWQMRLHPTQAPTQTNA